MANVLINENSMTAIANAIRSKNGTQTRYKPAQMADAISAISSGGITPTGTKSITANGTYDVTNFASAQVNVPTGITPSGSQTFTENGTYDVTSLAEAVVDVPARGYELEDFVERDFINGDIITSASKIGNYAFAGVSFPLNSVTADEAITIHPRAFFESAIKRFSGHKITKIDFGGFQSSQVEMITAPNLLGSDNFNQYAVSSCRSLKTLDMNGQGGINRGSIFNYDFVLDTLILRSTTLCPLDNISEFLSTPFRGYNGLIGTLYVPSALVEDYKVATNWANMYTNGTMNILPIEGSIYETQYADGTTIPTV